MGKCECLPYRGDGSSSAAVTSSVHRSGRSYANRYFVLYVFPSDGCAAALALPRQETRLCGHAQPRQAPAARGLPAEPGPRPRGCGFLLVGRKPIVDAKCQGRGSRLCSSASRLASLRARRRTFMFMGSVRSMGNLLQGKRGPELEDNSASIGAVLSRIHFADVPALLPLCPDVFEYALEAIERYGARRGGWLASSASCAATRSTRVAMIPCREA